MNMGGLAEPVNQSPVSALIRQEIGRILGVWAGLGSIVLVVPTLYVAAYNSKRKKSASRMYLAAIHLPVHRAAWE